MLSLLEVLHQLPAPRGDNHTNYGRPAGPQQSCSAVCPACKKKTNKKNPAIIHCINEWLLFLCTVTQDYSTRTHDRKQCLIDSSRRMFSRSVKLYNILYTTLLHNMSLLHFSIKCRSPCSYTAVAINPLKDKLINQY